MKVMKDKVRRKRVNWHRELLKLKDADLEHEFCVLSGKLHHGHSFSAKRCAYYVLKKHYTTTTIAELCEKLGI